MPSKSAKQANFMRAVAHSPAFAKKVGVAQSVGKDFEMADKKKMRKFASGDSIGSNVQSDVSKSLSDIIGGAKRPDMSGGDDELKAAVAPKKAPTFNEAFREARAAGKKTFTWWGGTYGTQLAGEGKRPTPKPATQSAPKATPKSKDFMSDYWTNQYSKDKAQRSTDAAKTYPKAAPKTGDVSAATKAKLAKTPILPTKSSPKASAKNGFKPGPFSNLPKDDTAKRYGFAKGGSIDGCAIRGKTRAPLKKGK